MNVFDELTVMLNRVQDQISRISHSPVDVIAARCAQARLDIDEIKKFMACRRRDVVDYHGIPTVTGKHPPARHGFKLQHCFPSRSGRIFVIDHVASDDGGIIRHMRGGTCDTKTPNIRCAWDLDGLEINMFGVVSTSKDNDLSWDGQHFAR